MDFKTLAFQFCPLTNDAENVSDVGYKDDQQVDHEEQTDCDADVADPVEGLVWEEQLQQSPADLNTHTHTPTAHCEPPQERSLTQFVVCPGKIKQSLL